jgi:hypothetical protein
VPCPNAVSFAGPENVRNGSRATAVARNLGDTPEPFSVTMALSITRDVLTSIRHQDELLVMEPGGYGSATTGGSGCRSPSWRSSAAPG